MAEIQTVTKSLDGADLLGYHLVYDDGKTLTVPKDESNRHYNEILEWIAAGNTPAEPG